MVDCAEYPSLHGELLGLGVPYTTDIIIARVKRAGSRKIESMKFKNVGAGNITITLQRRGHLTTVSAENIDAKEVGSTDQFRGTLANRRVEPGTVKITDATPTTPQIVEDTNSDGILWQTSGPSGPSYPVQVGNIEYNEATIDFTFAKTVATSVTLDYKHSAWAALLTPVSFTIVAGGGEYPLILKPTQTDNLVKSMGFDYTELGIAAKLSASGQAASSVNIRYEYKPPVEDMKLPMLKGEFAGVGDDGFPFHTH